MYNFTMEKLHIFAERLKGIRESTGLTQVEFAKKINKAKNNILAFFK